MLNCSEKWEKMEFEFGYQRFKVRLLPLILDSLCEGPHVGVVMISCFIKGYRLDLYHSITLS